MNDKLSAECELFAQNRHDIGKAFKWEMEMEAAAAALVFTNAGVNADIEKMKECRKILEKKTGAFSSFRSSCMLFVLSKMALSDSPEKYLDEIIELYDKIKKGTVFDNGYMVLAACILSEHEGQQETDVVIEKYKEIHKLLDKKHPIMSSSADIPFEMQMALCGKDIKAMEDEIEHCTEVLKKDFKWDKTAIYKLAHALVLTNGSMDDKCRQVLDIYTAFKDRGVKYSKDSAFTSLAALTGLDIGTDELADEILAADKLLAEHKGFSGWSMDSKHRLMFAASLAANVFDKNSNDTGAVLGNSLAIILAEEIAVTVMMTLMMTSAATASSN